MHKTKASIGKIDRKIIFIVFWLLSVSKLASMMKMDDPDLWGHVLYGTKHLSTGSLSLVDTFSYTANGLKWINHEWLSELIFAYLWNSFGVFGLWCIRFIVVACLFYLVLKLLFENTKGVWASLLVFIPCFFTVARGFAIRPQIFSFLLFFVIIYIIQQIYFEAKWSRWFIIFFCPIMALWVNLHGGFLMGIGMILLLIVYEIFLYLQKTSSIKILVSTICCLILAITCTIVNPYGLNLLEWIAESLLTSRSYKITEWYPVYLYPNQLDLLGYYILVAVLLYVLIFYRDKRSFFEWSLLLILCFLGWMNNRNIVFFGFVCFVLLPKHLEAIFPNLLIIPKFKREFLYSILIFTSVYSTGIFFFPGHKPTKIIIETAKQPYNAIRFIRNNNLKGNLLCYFNWAQMAIWYLHDQCKIAFDGRFRTVYPKTIENEYFKFQNIDKDWSNILNKYDTDIILMPSDWPGGELLLKNRDWLLIYRSDNFKSKEAKNIGEKATIFIRRNKFQKMANRIKNGKSGNVDQQLYFYFGKPII